LELIFFNFEIVSNI